ncbi:insulinase family protein [Aerococcus kribbianus]|uniref:Insulinase family protein n=1 Tax=Aerococcus kribbianus TaxID=2999064 RepID=A0A9X3FW42_9LACT|nr:MULTISPECIES: insulinase family protein [unclassified Aerococcus]MCZ0717972.1 insulinase family protein [Aerococcus sp. YH-aer221]MCZ0726259.1 insulinase family protein [Aerococcus sp. YH-aer222]
MTNYKHGFNEISKEYLADIDATVWRFDHPQSGGQVMWIDNDDRNRSFAIGFLTPPEDSTGVAHIVEHSVLSGSRKYSVKDPFMQMMKTSMATFLNALTFSDMTVYPVSSMNEEDFHHLMDVYLDAVFYPKMLSQPNIFKQEGWHKEILSSEDPITISGVVYNEMRGAFADVDRAIVSAVAENLHPQSTYSHESGGNPYVIPDLTYQDFCRFHQDHYRPDNALLCLYGAVDIDRALAQIDEEYFAEFTTNDQPISLALPTIPCENKVKTLTYPADDTMTADQHSYLTYTLPFTTVTNREEAFLLPLLAEALVDAEASPLRQAIVEAGYAEDISAYPADGYYQDFGIIVENMNSQQADQIVAIIEETLARVAKQGLDRNLLAAIMNSREFYYRQAGGAMRGITHSIQMLSVWRYGERPLSGLEYESSFAFFREQLQSDYYEKIIHNRLVEAKTKQVLIHEPQANYFISQDQTLEEKLAQEKARLSQAEIDQLIQDNLSLREYQNQADQAEDLAKLPQLHLDDVPTKTQVIPEETLSHSPLILFHGQEAAGVRYISLSFALDQISADAIPYLKDLAILLGALPTENYSYQDLDTELMKLTAGLSFQPKVYALDSESYKSQMAIDFAAIGDNSQPALDLVTEIITCSDFSQKARIKNILTRVKTEMEQYFEASGHQAALARLRSFYSQASLYGERLAGLAYYDHLVEFLAHFDQEFASWQERIREINNLIWDRDRLIVSLAADASDKESLLTELQAFAHGLTSSGRQVQAFPDLELPTINSQAITTNSNVQYVAMGGGFASDDYRGQALVLANIVSKGYLYDHIRVQSGAYGAGLTIRPSGDLGAYSYRDPKLDQSLTTYRGIGESLRKLSLSQSQLDQFIIGSMKAFHYPITPAKANQVMLTRYLKGISKEAIDRRLTEALATSLTDLQSYADFVDKIMADPAVVVIGNKQNILDSKFAFDHIRALKEKEQSD